MKINKIILKNFKSYYGENILDFNNGLNIISGKIGTGKTSLFEAFQWILIDNLPYSQKKIDPKFILNGKAKKEGLSSQKELESSVTIVVQDHDLIFSIKKANYYKVGNGEYYRFDSKMTISYDDTTTGSTEIIDNLREIEVKLDYLFPEQLRRYLLFKGENLKELLDFSNKSTLRNAVNQISYLPIFDRMLSIIETITTKTEKKYNNILRKHSSNEKERKNIDQTINHLEKKKNELKEQIDQKSNSLSKLKEEKESFVEKLVFLAGYPALEKEKNDLISKQEKLLQKKSDLHADFKAKFSSKWMLLGTNNLIESAETELGKFKDWRRNEISKNKEELEIGVPGDDLIRRMLDHKRCLICKTEAPKGSDEYESIESHLDKNKTRTTLEFLSEENEFLNDLVVDLSHKPAAIKSSLSQTLEEIKSHRKREREVHDDYLSVAEERKQKESAIRELIEDKGYSITNIDHKTVNSALKNVENEISRLTNEKRHDSIPRLNMELESIESRITQKKNDLEKLVDSNLDLSKLAEKKALIHLQKIEEVIKERVVIEKRELIQKIEDKANAIQEDIIFNSKDNNIVVVYVNIDKETYEISFVDKEGNENPGHGAQDTLAKLSIISAVLKLSNDYKGESYPFVVDAPTSNFDDTIIDSFIQSLSNNFSQSLVILKDIEPKLANYKNKDFVNSIHQLKKSDNSEGHSVVLDNSFTTIQKFK